MKNLIYCFCFISLLGCKKENQGPRIEIYTLKSFTSSKITQPGSHYVESMSDAVLDDEPIVSNEEIRYYKEESHTFKLKTNINNRIKNFRKEKGFAVTINGNPVYLGKFHPGHLSSHTMGLATIDPFMTKDAVTLRYVFIVGDENLKLLDKRNDARLIKALKASRRLK